jgi:pimeloyl-ACP methyl ester carboxylesterase
MFIKTRGTSLFVSSFGAGGRTALALGGWIGSGEMWLPVLGRLSENWRTVTFDQRGSGTSHVRDDREISPQAWVDDVFAVMDAARIERCLLMSDSSGCFPAVLAALKSPERFTGLVLIGSAPRMPMDSTRRLFALGLRFASRPVLKQFARMCLPEDETGHVRRWLWDICVRADARSAIRLLKTLARFDLRDVAPKVSTPTLIVHGSRDLIVPLSEGKALASLIPGSDLIVMEGKGHVPMMSSPDEVALIIQKWAEERGLTARQPQVAGEAKASQSVS